MVEEEMFAMAVLALRRQVARAQQMDVKHSTPLNAPPTQAGARREVTDGRPLDDWFHGGCAPVEE